MRHARSDYDHIQDLSQFEDLRTAYEEAMRIIAEGPRAGAPDIEDLKRFSRALSQLCINLHPMIASSQQRYRSSIPSDEPVFLLRAKDQIAPAIVRAYAKMHHGDERFVRACTAQADRMEDYAREHYHGGKEADAPDEALRL